MACLPRQLGGDMAPSFSGAPPSQLPVVFTHQPVQSVYRHKTDTHTVMYWGPPRPPRTYHQTEVAPMTPSEMWFFGSV